MSSSSIGRRVDALEALGGVSEKGVAGIVRGRGQNYDPAANAHIERQVAELHAAGHSIVYVANLASSRPIRGPIGSDTAPTT